MTRTDDAERQRLQFQIAELMPVIVALMQWHQRPSPITDAALHAAVDAWRASAPANGGAR